MVAQSYLQSAIFLLLFIITLGNYIYTNTQLVLTSKRTERKLMGLFIRSPVDFKRNANKGAGSIPTHL